ncbi:MAG: RsmD family RNA methyltransferase [Chloroflexota bacterium]
MPDGGRVVTGSAGGLRLAAPGAGTRPLSDKVKQALFSILEAERDDVWDHAMLDLFAGSGAAGIEALSRGAPRAVLVERDGRTVALIRQNLEHTGLAAQARVVRGDVLTFLAAPANVALEGPFGSVVIDPPYEQIDDLRSSLARLADPEAGWLDASALVAAKHFWRDDPPEQSGVLVRVRQRRFGETALSVYRHDPESSAGGC